MSKNKYLGKKGLTSKAEREAKEKEEHDKILDEMIGPKGTPERDKFDAEMEANPARLITDKDQVKEAVFGKVTEYPNLDVRIFFDPEKPRDNYCAEFAGNPSELARALFFIARQDPMWREIIAKVHLEILRVEEVDKGEDLVKHKD